MFSKIDTFFSSVPFVCVYKPVVSYLILKLLISPSSLIFPRPSLKHNHINLFEIENPLKTAKNNKNSCLKKSWQPSKVLRLKLKGCLMSDNVEKILTDIFIVNIIINQNRINMPITAFRVRKVSLLVAFKNSMSS